MTILKSGGGFTFIKITSNLLFRPISSLLKLQIIKSSKQMFSTCIHKNRKEMLLYFWER